jgi:hypothetical protein
MRRKKSRVHRLGVELAVTLLAVYPAMFLSAAGEPPKDPTVTFELTAINGVPLHYVSISPTDGDILDRGLFCQSIRFNFRASRGDVVQCLDAASGRALSVTEKIQCTTVDPTVFVCFELSFDTRVLPNGPNRLLFRLRAKEPGIEEGKQLSYLTLLIHVLNTRLEVDRNGVDSVRLRLTAGVLDPATVKNYRYAIFAAASTRPWSNPFHPYVNPGDREQLFIPIGGAGPEPKKLYPSGEPIAAAWPDRQLAVFVDVSWNELEAIARQANSPVTYLVAAVHNGTRWDFSSVLEVTPPTPGEGLSPEP